MKITAIATKWLFILCLPVLLLTASIGWAFNSLWLYEYGFNKYDISRNTGLAQSELDRAAIGLIHYFNSGEENISLTVTKDGKAFTLFNEREVAHLRDVKGLVWLDYWAALGTLVYVLGYAGVSLFWRKNRRRLAQAVLWGSGLSLALMLLMGLGMLLDFNQLFLLFHLISFSNDFWMLDPTRDYLIMLFPSGFWFDAALFCALAAALGAVILGGVAIIFLRRTSQAATH